MAATRTAIDQRNCADAKLQVEDAERRQRPDGNLNTYLLESTAKRDVFCRQATISKALQEAVDGQVAAEKAALEMADKAAAAAPTPAATPACKGTLQANGTRCFTWHTRLSLGTSSLGDIMALIVRFATGTR